MKIKLHFAIVVVILAFLGAFMDQKTVPNQQIVVQFLDKSVSIGLILNELITNSMKHGFKNKIYHIPYFDYLA